METIDDRVRKHAAARPDEAAVIGPAGALTWRQLDEAADRAAGTLAGRGIGPGDRVGFLGRNDCSYPVLLLATWRRRATLVGLNWRLSADELARVLRIADVALLVSDDVASVPAVGGSVDVVDPATLLAGDDSAPVETTALAPEPCDDALLFFTSGSTGTPKGVVLARGPNDRAGLAPTPFHMCPGACALIVPPTFHVAGSVWVQLSLAAGTTAVFVADARPAALVDALLRHDVTHALLVPTLLRMVVAEVRRRGIRLPALQHVAYGSAPIPQSLLREAMAVIGCQFTQVYGLTETGGAAVNLPPEDHVLEGPRSGRLLSAGVPVPGVELRITDDAGVPRPTGTPGELRIRSAFMMRGYWRDPARTSRVLDAEGWLRTGDLGHLDADGYLYINGRSDDMVITGGENVFPGEVERVIGELPGVIEAAVFGVPDEHWGERVCAAVVVADSALTPAAILAHCRERVAHYKCPTQVELVPELPRTATGKVAKSLLRTRVEGQR